MLSIGEIKVDILNLGANSLREIDQLIPPFSHYYGVVFYSKGYFIGVYVLAASTSKMKSLKFFDGQKARWFHIDPIARYMEDMKITSWLETWNLTLMIQSMRRWLPCNLNHKQMTRTRCFDFSNSESYWCPRLATLLRTLFCYHVLRCKIWE